MSIGKRQFHFLDDKHANYYGWKVYYILDYGSEKFTLICKIHLVGKIVIYLCNRFALLSFRTVKSIHLKSNSRWHNKDVCLLLMTILKSLKQQNSLPTVVVIVE